MQAVERNTEINNLVYGMDVNLLTFLLKDMTTGKNILWATDTYARLGDMFAKNAPISADLIAEGNMEFVKPRVNKTKDEQASRVKDNAEVFTPAWICNAQNNLVDDAWFAYIGAFNKEGNRSWKTNENPVKFPTDSGKTWQDYVNLVCLEITCGEAPYLVSRYDAVTGEIIELRDRVGRLDRKIRAINENVDIGDKDAWLEWVKTAYKCTYGFEMQGDNLFIARKNLLYSFVEYYEDRFNEKPDLESLREISEIIVWNIWQMDGLKGVVPYSCMEGVIETCDMFGEKTRRVVRCPGCEKDDMFKHNGIYCKIMNWKTGKQERYIDGIARK